MFLFNSETQVYGLSYKCFQLLTVSCNIRKATTGSIIWYQQNHWSPVVEVWQKVKSVSCGLAT